MGDHKELLEKIGQRFRECMNAYIGLPMDESTRQLMLQEAQTVLRGFPHLDASVVNVLTPQEAAKRMCAHADVLKGVLLFNPPRYDDPDLDAAIYAVSKMIDEFPSTPQTLRNQFRTVLARMELRRNMNFMDRQLGEELIYRVYSLANRRENETDRMELDVSIKARPVDKVELRMKL